MPMPRRIGSFVEFLKTGALGNVLPGKSRLSVLREFGNPERWGEYPLMSEKPWEAARFWIYGNVEICFAADEAVDWIKIFFPTEIDSVSPELPAFVIEGFPARPVKVEEFVELLKNEGLWDFTKVGNEGAACGDFVLPSRVFVFAESEVVSHLFVRFDSLRPSKI
jgi:hypothetical protein